MSQSQFSYSTVDEYFFQNHPSTDPADFDYTVADFGLIPRSYDTDNKDPSDPEMTHWQRFDAKIASLNERSEPHVQFKLLYIVC